MLFVLAARVPPEAREVKSELELVIETMARARPSGCLPWSPSDYVQPRHGEKIEGQRWLGVIGPATVYLGRLSGLLLNESRYPFSGKRSKGVKQLTAEYGRLRGARGCRVAPRERHVSPGDSATSAAQAHSHGC